MALINALGMGEPFAFDCKPRIVAASASYDEISVFDGVLILTSNYVSSGKQLRETEKCPRGGAHYCMSRRR
jgi:hypothetical protein